MADATTTAEQSSGATATRLSPKGRSLPREHDLEAGGVRVSGGGRVKVGDVEQVRNDRASGPAGRASATERRPRATAASLLVRRRLRAGAVRPSEVVGTGTGGGFTRDDAARAVEAARAQAEPASMTRRDEPPHRDHGR
jgi:pyruvate/2-oxoglutarate dehydrogenase complex dihydrolipoamide acyltransferase (E2) component